jgi:hypothetical protein
VVTPEQGRDYLLRQAEHSDDPLSIYGRLALEWGLRANKLSQEWAEWAAEELARSQAARPSD